MVLEASSPGVLKKWINAMRRTNTTVDGCVQWMPQKLGTERILYLNEKRSKFSD